MSKRRARTRPSVDRLVGDLYGALADGATLTAATEQIAVALRSHITGLHHEQLGVSAEIEFSGVFRQPELIDFSDTYARRWHGQNLWVERGAATLLGTGYASTEFLVSSSELVASEYYQHFLTRIDVRHAVGITVMNDASTLALLSFNRRERAGPPSIDDMRLVAQLRPHLVNAYALHRRFRLLEARSNNWRDAFDCAPIGMLALDREGRILERNAAGDAMLRSKRGLSQDVTGRLRISRPDGQRKLIEALHAFAVSPTPPPPCAVRIGHGECKLVAYLHASPSSLYQRVSCLAILIDVEREGDERWCRSMLQVVLGLTGQEAAAALALRRAGDPEAAAALMGVQVSTVRTHLKQAFRKVGVGRQTELVRQIDRLVSLAP